MSSRLIAVRVWPLPLDLTEDQLREIHLALVEAAKSIPFFRIESEQDFTVGFPRDMMAYGLGSDIVIEALCDIENVRSTEGKTIGDLGLALRSAVKRFYPNAKLRSIVIDCYDVTRIG